MSIVEVKAPSRAKSAIYKPRVPPLEVGDHLTRAEFERRYDDMPRVKRAELIEGVVYMPSPIKVTHGEPHGETMAWLGAYCAATPGVKLYDNTTVRLDADNEVQPGALLRLEPADGGRSRVSTDDFLEGAPELIVEIAGTSAAIDLHAKKKVYRRSGVPEYIVWQVYDERVDWFELRDEKYVPLTPDETGVLRSRVFPGLWLAVEALLAGDLAAVLSKLQEGLASAEHHEFVRKLKSEG